MKKQELKQLIREEIKKVLSEDLKSKFLKISQKIITSEKYEDTLESIGNRISKKLIDKIAKYELDSSQYKFYISNFEIIKPYIEDDLGNVSIF